MSFLNGLRGIWNQKPELEDEWVVPETTAELEQFFKEDSGITVIYKHSYSCGVSLFAKSRLDKYLETFNKHAKLVFIDVKLMRLLSNTISEKAGVRHESPQLIILHNGSVYWHGSHNSVQADPIIESIEEITGKQLSAK